MQVKTSELTGNALDWAVAKCEEWTGDFIDMPNYSTDWRHGGPIIERGCDRHIMIKGMGAFSDYPREWSCALIADDHMYRVATGPTLLVSAMRCYVASKLGDTVDIPEDML